MRDDACDECGSTEARCKPGCSERETPAEYPACVDCGADEWAMHYDYNGRCAKCAEARREAEYDG